MEDIKKEYEKKYELLRNEVFTAESCFFAYKTIRSELENEVVYTKANSYSAFLNTVLASLYSHLFIVLGRIFDKDTEAFSINHFINYCSENIDLFSKEQLTKRRAKDFSQDRLEEYMDKFPDIIVTVEEMRVLKKIIGSYQNTFDSKYRDIRHKLIAHKEPFETKKFMEFMRTETEEID